MTGLNGRNVLAAAMSIAMVFAVTAGAQAHDERRWERERWEHRHRHGPVVHRHYHEAGPRVIHERQPVVVMPAPVYAAPAYAPPANPSLNFNFHVPLQ